MTILKTAFAVVLYAALSMGAIPVSANDLEALRIGDMRKLTFHNEPRPLAKAQFLDAAEAPLTISAFNGKYVLLNFWATWCAPCREEMPSLDALNKELGSDAFEVITIATGRNPTPMIKRFFAQQNIETLDIYRDPKQTLAREMSVFGLPLTVLLNKEGQEIARLRGDAHWDSDEAKELIKAILANGH